MLVRLLYASRAAAAVDDDALAAILRQCRANNPALGVTGVLCFSGGLFMQVLEGGRSVVNRIYNGIVADPRHTDVVLLSYEEISERRFAGWSMGQVEPGAPEPGAAAEVFRDRGPRPLRAVGPGVDGAVRGAGGHGVGVRLSRVAHSRLARGAKAEHRRDEPGRELPHAAVVVEHRGVEVVARRRKAGLRRRRASSAPRAVSGRRAAPGAP